MGEFVVLKDQEWKPQVKSRLLTAPVMKIDVRFDDVDLKLMPPNQKKIFDTEFKKWEAEFKKLQTSKLKTINEAVLWTEKRIAHNPNDAQRKEVTETANKMLGQGFKVFENEIKALAQKFYETAVLKSYQIIKAAVRKATAKAIVKIVVIVGLTLTAAALAIASTVATGGAIWVVAAAVALKGAKAMYSSYAAINKHWVSASTSLKALQKDIVDLQKATKALAEQQKLAASGKASKFQQVKAAISGTMVELGKHAAELDDYITVAQGELNDQQKKLTTLMTEIDKTKDPKVKAQADKLKTSIDAAGQALGKLRTVRTEADKTKAAWDSTNKIDVATLVKGLQLAPTAAQALSTAYSSMKGLQEAISVVAQHV